MSQAEKKLKVLFLCTGNSCRSQMAEGWARHLKGDVVEAYSAGIETHGLNPLAVKVMAEAGVDISGHRSKHLREVMGVEFDCVVTVCDHAHESCPLFPGKAKIVHRSFDDPPRLARDAKTEEEALEHYRRVRDEIQNFVQTLPDSLTDTSGGRICGKGPFTITSKGATDRPLRMHRDPYCFFARLYDILFARLGTNMSRITSQWFPPTQTMKVLDVGCGTGRLLDLCRKHASAMYGVDASPSMLRIARSRLGGSAELHCGDASEMPYDQDTFDLVIISMALHEMEWSACHGVISEMKRVVKRRGHILIIDYCTCRPRSLRGWFARQIITLSEIVVGVTHFRHYRHFMRAEGLRALIKMHDLSVEKQRSICSGSLLALLLTAGENGRLESRRNALSVPKSRLGKGGKEEQ